MGPHLRAIDLTYAMNHPATALLCADLRDPGTQRSVIEFCRKRRIWVVLGAVPCEWLSIRRNVGPRLAPAEQERQRRLLDALLDLIRVIGAAQLQGFPQDYVFVGSPSDCWKMIGQAVEIETARRILGAICAAAAQPAADGPRCQSSRETE